MFHLQTIVLGLLPVPAARVQGSRRHAPHGRSDRRRRRRARPRRMRPGCRTCAAASSSTAASGHPITEAMHTAAGRAAQRAHGRVDRARQDGRRSRCRARTCRRPTNRVDLDPAVRDVWGLPAGRVTYQPHAHDVACAHHWGPRLEAVMREAGARPTTWVTSPGTPGIVARPISSRSPATGWARRGMGDDPRASVCDPWQRLWDVDNVRHRRLVGVPDFDGLRADADARRARDPRRRVRWPASL